MLRMPAAVVSNVPKFNHYGYQFFRITQNVLLRYQSTTRPPVPPAPPTAANVTSAKTIPAPPQHPPSSRIAPTNASTTKATLQSPGIGANSSTFDSSSSSKNSSFPHEPNGSQGGDGGGGGGGGGGRFFKLVFLSTLLTGGAAMAYAAYDPRFKATVKSNVPFLSGLLDTLPDISGSKSKNNVSSYAGPRIVTKDKPSDNAEPLNRKFADTTKNLTATNNKVGGAEGKNALISKVSSASAVPNAKQKIVSDPTSPSTTDNNSNTVADLSKQKLQPTSQSAYQSPPPPGQSSSHEQLIHAQTVRIEELEKQVRELNDWQRRDTDEFTLRFRQLSAEAIERARRKAQSEIIIDEKDLEDALHKQRNLLDEEFQKHIFSLRESFEQELQRQLKRQVSVHSETMNEQLRKQENELLHQFESNLRIELNRQRGEFDDEVSTTMARLRGLEAAVDARADAEKQFKQAQDLWHACQALKQTFLTGNDQSLQQQSSKQKAGGDTTTPFGKPTPLLGAVQSVSDASMQQPFVRTIIQAIPPDALYRGVSSEEELRDRFDKVRRVARRLAMVGDDLSHVSLFRYFLSYLQSFLMFEPLVSAVQTKFVPAVDGSGGEPKQGIKFDTMKILALARKSLENGDIESAARLANQLTGLPRVVAADWLREARLYLETRQAVDVLLAHAQAVGLGTVPRANRDQR